MVGEDASCQKKAFSNISTHSSSTALLFYTSDEHSSSLPKLFDRKKYLDARKERCLVG